MRIAKYAMAIIALAVLCQTAFAQTPDQAISVRWKAVEQAEVKLDDKTPLGWNVYQPDQKKDKKDKKKDSDLILILLGHRYLMLDTKSHVVYLVNPPQLKADGKGFDSGDLAQSSQVIPTTDWILRDVGPAETIQLTLGDYGRNLEVEIPHMPDLRAFY